MTFPIIEQANLPPNTIVPTNPNLFIPYLSDLYQEIATAMNQKDDVFFAAAITSTAQSIPNVPNFGSFIICVSGATTSLPTITASLCKADANSSGSAATLGSQVGTGAWAGFALIISSTSTNFQIRHNRTGVSGNFNIKVIGTQ